MAKHSFSTFALVLPALLAASGCAATCHEVRTPTFVPGQRGVVFAVDGAGGFQATSTALREAIQEACLPLGVEEVEWSHGFGRILSDEMDYCHARDVGERLACAVATVRQNCPNTRIYLVGHSAGSAIVLAAAESLPPASVDRIVLLAPSVSAEYDLRPALCCARQGIDVFCSERDIGYLGVGVAIVGTADRRWDCPAAGRTGFFPVIATPCDTCLYAKLNQHPWSPCVEWSGNDGGHYGGYQPGFLRAYVLPLLNCP